MKLARTAVVARPDQMRVLASPVRQELLDALARLDRVSLAELGAVLGRPADGLYYHVRLLVKAGLVREAGTRLRHGRSEALFQARAGEFELRYAASPAGHVRAINAIVGSMLRLGSRDFRRALAGDRLRLEGPSRDLWALRMIGWLTPRQVRQVNRRIEELRETATRNEPKGRLYAVTVLLTPLSHRANRAGRRARQRTAR